MPTAHDEGMEQPRPGDEQILQQQGAAILLWWDDLSFESQTRILDRANDIIGLAPMPEARNEIVKLLRHATQGLDPRTTRRCRLSRM